MLRVAAVCLALWIAPILVAGIDPRVERHTRSTRDVLQQGSVDYFRRSLRCASVRRAAGGRALSLANHVTNDGRTWRWPKRLPAHSSWCSNSLASLEPGRIPETLPPLLAATLGAAITTWSTFLPCFLFILVFAPLVDHVRHLQALDAALSTITAAVVGVILNLAVWFGQHVLFPLGRPDPYAIFLALLFFVGLWRGKWEIIPVVFAGCLFGLVGKLLLGV